MLADLIGSDAGTQRSASPPPATVRGSGASGAAGVKDGSKEDDGQDKNLMKNPCKCCRRSGCAAARPRSADCKDCRGYFRYAHRDKTPQEIAAEQVKQTAANDVPAVCQSFVENELQKYIDMKAFWSFHNHSWEKLSSNDLPRSRVLLPTYALLCPPRPTPYLPASRI